MIFEDFSVRSPAIVLCGRAGIGLIRMSGIKYCGDFRAKLGYLVWTTSQTSS